MMKKEKERWRKKRKAVISDQKMIRGLEVFDLMIDARYGAVHRGR